MTRNSSVFLVISMALAACGSSEKTIQPEKKSITEVVYASGNLYPEEEYKLFSNVTGYLAQAFVNEGDTIEIGTELFLIESGNRGSESTAAANALQIAIENAGKNSPAINQLRERLIAAKLKAETDSVNSVRYKNLLATGSIAQADYDRIHAQAESSRREANALKEQITGQQNALELELTNARNRFNLASNNLSDGLLKSKIIGKVYEVYKKPGDFIHQNEAIALIGDNNTPVARLSVDENDYELVHDGQEVLITLDAYPDKTFKAVIAKIYPKLNKAEQSFRVDARFTQQPPSGIYGLNLEANIVVRSVQDVITIPRTALLSGDSVRVMRDGKPTMIHVSKGAGDLTRIEITSGISLEDELVVPN